ncbi:DeoR/GlpR family DNA-binding transcription regulator [Salimicrobium halophilum]|uniref:DNA-binding transcriptional regulator of sugar metabolism, DeoR/GlpR family n=1 Tax=Salimicrobium halophilum TaxID=86666 RepID=A0A1G8WMB6_9BACI|nr:DeoR/GlpR family DNA-binding transcription regulator [Salimicrobium halophilum]SDJ79193.1 DNA-binding transcriptional regulator of sugar metabolism, DeoR/GlpR family [Salimicrobium halophilum]
MYQEERIEEILNMLEQQQRIRVEDVCEAFDVSRDTARRDLVKLSERGEIVRVHGGAMLPKRPERLHYKERLAQANEEKQRIGKLAASFIKNQDSVIFDTSTTVQSLIRYMEVESVTAVTNSVYAAELLSDTSADIHLLGGQLNKEQRFLYGPSVLEKLEDFRTDKAFVGTLGISEEGLSSYHEEDGYVKKKMIQRADEVIVVADHSKMERYGFYTFSSLEEVDVVVTDKEPSSRMKDVFEQYAVTWITAD